MNSWGQKKTIWILILAQPAHVLGQLYTFQALQLSVTCVHTRFYNTHFQSNWFWFWYFWPFRHLIRVMIRHDMTNQKDIEKDKVNPRYSWQRPLTFQTRPLRKYLKKQCQKTSKTFLKVVFWVLHFRADYGLEILSLKLRIELKRRKQDFW